MQLAGNLSPQERALLQHRPLAKLFLKWVWFCIESTNIFVRELFDHANQRKFSPTEISRYTVYTVHDVTVTSYKLHTVKNAV